MTILKKLMVTGMSCQHCKHSIESTLKDLNGIKNVTANHNEGFVDVEFDNNQINVEKIIQEIEDLGYEVK